MVRSFVSRGTIATILKKNFFLFFFNFNAVLFACSDVQFIGSTENTNTSTESSTGVSSPLNEDKTLADEHEDESTIVIDANLDWGRFSTTTHS